MIRVDEAMARRAASQYGLITRPEALAAGCTQRMIDRRVSSGRWVRIATGVYRLAGAPVTWNQRVLAACLCSGSEAVASHRTAAVLYGVSGFRPGPVSITVPAGRSARNPLATVHRTTLLPSLDRGTVDRVPVTAPARLLVDLAGEVSPPTLEEAVDDLLCRRLVALERLRARAEALGRRPGAAVLDKILTAWTPGALPDSVAEMQVVRDLVAIGLPRRCVSTRSGSVENCWPASISPIPTAGLPSSSTRSGGTPAGAPSRATAPVETGSRRPGGTCSRPPPTTAPPPRWRPSIRLPLPFWGT